eukprot:TRINITY_DN6258_c0_g1_i1.p2 TRINITY_DN6258_c0_g1~~TRINITY_DN6258_c0_g1_i1.p2  ORF type:complete len:136 (-),score=31.39 TRINITY_DN6258_c0_g1_i1:452-859(-)
MFSIIKDYQRSHYTQFEKSSEEYKQGKRTYIELKNENEQTMLTLYSEKQKIDLEDIVRIFQIKDESTTKESESSGKGQLKQRKKFDLKTKINKDQIEKIFNEEEVPNQREDKLDLDSKPQDTLPNPSDLLNQSTV